MHQLNGGVHVHGGAGEVIVLADADDVGVLELLVEQGVGVSAVAVVGGPIGCRVGESRGAVRRRNSHDAGGQHKQIQKTQ